jgi:LPPG:FO 2-phospho-L-lactate transferase
MSVKVALLCGGVGGAKLARGFHLLAPDVELKVIVNTGDDFEHLGLLICPDIDTVLYTLTDQANQAQGWGREDESWAFMRVLRSLGGEDWFQLGDGDLALHVFRTEQMRQGRRLSHVVQEVSLAWQLGTQVLPMSDHPVRTLVHSDEGVLAFQRYFVERRCRPLVQAISFAGSETARPGPGVMEAIEEADVIAIAPSNPYLSIDPILAVPGIADTIRKAKVPVIAVSPLVGGKAVKGPTDKLMGELGFQIGNATIARHYDGLITGLLVHQDDPAPEHIHTASANTMMRDDMDRMRVAREVLALAVQVVA